MRSQRESEPLRTAGALRSISDLKETLLVVNGDVLADLDPAPMLDFRHNRNATLTITTHHAQVGTELG